MNKNGVGLRMQVDPPESFSSRIQKVHFWLERSPSIRLTGYLDVDLLKFGSSIWGGHSDFQRLIPRIVYDLVNMEEAYLIEEAIREERGQNVGL